jgi:hypothetical protein
MFALAYASKALRIFSDEDLDELSAQASKKNSELRVTGYLNYKNGTFFQYLEGRESAVRQLMDVIAADSRHRVLNIVELGDIGGRRFRDWSMRFITPYEMSVIRMEDVLENVLVGMKDKTFGREKVRDTVMRIVDKIALAKGALPAAMR